AEQLLAAAEFDVRVNLDAVVPLHERVQAFVQVDRRARLAPLREVVALEHALDRDLARQREDVEEREPGEPVAVAMHLGLADVDDLADLLEVVDRVGLDLLLREPGARLIAPARIADERGVVADDEDGVVAEFLKETQLSQRDGVAEVDVDAGRVDAVLDAK